MATVTQLIVQIKEKWEDKEWFKKLRLNLAKAMEKRKKTRNILCDSVKDVLYQVNVEGDRRSSKSGDEENTLTTGGLGPREMDTADIDCEGTVNVDGEASEAEEVFKLRLDEESDYEHNILSSTEETDNSECFDSRKSVHSKEGRKRRNSSEVFSLSPNGQGRKRMASQEGIEVVSKKLSLSPEHSSRVLSPTGQGRKRMASQEGIEVVSKKLSLSSEHSSRVLSPTPEKESLASRDSSEVPTTAMNEGSGGAPEDNRVFQLSVSSEEDWDGAVLEHPHVSHSAQETTSLKMLLLAPGHTRITTRALKYVSHLLVSTNFADLKHLEQKQRLPPREFRSAIQFFTDIDMINVDDRGTIIDSGLKDLLACADGSHSKVPALRNDSSVQELLTHHSFLERRRREKGLELYAVLNTPTYLEKMTSNKFKTTDGSRVREFCLNGTKEECRKIRGKDKACGKLHFHRITQRHTDESLGDCSFLNACFNRTTCKYVHYEIDKSFDDPEDEKFYAPRPKDTYFKLYPPQWIDCDIRYLDFSIIGKFAVIMADPPWDIHMELPYGTMSDDEMRCLKVPMIQDEGVIFLWVTGRAMELGRECLTLWGYDRVDEMVWVKVNQRQRLIRTGRTGHWLNHSKEHCLIGIKGNPDINRGLDGDVLLAEVRATSHKPDEIYGLIERLSPGTRKLEIFGRQHNCQHNWVTLGNQLNGSNIWEPDMKEKFYAMYPSGVVRAPPNM